MDRSRVLWTVAVAFGFLLQPTAAMTQQLKVKEFSILKFKIGVPEGFKEAEPATEKRVKLKLKDAQVRITRWAQQKKLDDVVKRMHQTAKDNGWTTVREGKLEINGNEAREMLFDIKSKKHPSVVTRQLFYFVSTKNGHYNIHLAALKAHFDEKLFKSVAMSFTPL